MKIKYKVIFVCYIVIFVCPNIFAYDFKVDGIYYNVIEDGVEVTNDAMNHIDYSGDIEIPSTVYWEGKSYPVIQIGKDSFSFSDSLKSVRISEGIVKIDDYAFKLCESLNNIILPSSLEKIGKEAFGGCRNLKSIYIPEGVNSISTDCFIYCSILSNVTVSPQNMYYNDGDGGNCIIRKDSHTLIIGTTKSKIPDYIQIIGEFAFYGRDSLKAIVLPKKLIKIENYAFFDNERLLSIHIPKDVESINPTAFIGCRKLCEITVDPYNPFYSDGNGSNCIIDKRNNTLVVGGNLTVIPNSVDSIGEDAFFVLSDMKEIIIPNSVKKIGRFSFSDCYSLRRVVIPDSVTEIGMWAFAADSVLTDVWLPKCLKKIEYGIFLECPKLETINIPPNVTEIRWGAFEDCIGIRKVYSYLEDPIPASYYRYSLDFKKCTLYVPKGTKEKYEVVEPWNTFGCIIEMDE